MGWTARALAIAVSLTACGDGGDGERTDASGIADATVTDAVPGPDATPPPGAIVRLTPDRFLAPAGEQVTVSWAAELATSCVVTTSGGDSQSGTSGSLVVTVDELTRVVASCDPPGDASLAAISLAPQCEGEAVFDALQFFNGMIVDGQGVQVTIPDDVCVVVTGSVGVFNPAPSDVVARLKTVGGQIFYQKAGLNGLDFVSLESVGRLLLDYQNGHFLPEVAGVDDTYMAFPGLLSITDPDDKQVHVASGRIDLRALGELAILINSYSHPMLYHYPRAIDLADGATIGSVWLSGTEMTSVPVVIGEPAGVTGDVTIRDNALLPHAAAVALVEALGGAQGVVTICNNLDDDPCP